MATVRRKYTSTTRINRLTNLVWKSAPGATLASFTYTLGPTGNRTALAETVSGAARTLQLGV